MIPWLGEDTEFPPVTRALREPNGLLAAGGDLSPERLLAAYRRGIFPWFSPGEPILWWSPDPRMVLLPAAMKLSRSLMRTLRAGRYEVRLDTAFTDVIRHCADTARPGQSGTWITRAMQQAYRRLHELGHAHSVEVFMDGELAGGLYGMAVGRAFFGESMFSLRRDASKIALAHLCSYLQRLEFGIIDCQMETRHLASLGARPIPRQEFLAALDRLVGMDRRTGPWPASDVADAFSRSPA